MSEKNCQWIGVDMDGVLAYYDYWKGSEHIGRPIPIMVKKVKKMINEGKNVKIFTARVCSNNPDREIAIKAIEKWCLEHLGCILPVTAEKDYYLEEYYDDRAIQVLPNIGISAVDYLLNNKLIYE